MITDPVERQHLWSLVNSYVHKYNVSQNDIVNLLQVVEASSIYSFTDPPGGCVYYAVYADTATVIYHTMYWGASSKNHSWNGAAASEVYNTNDNTVNVKDKDGKSHNIWKRNVIKGRIIIKPQSPTYYKNDSTKHFLYWTEDYNYTVNPILPTDITPFDFSKPVTRDCDLYTSWTDRNCCTVSVKKILTGTYGNPDTEKFTLDYKLITYKYEATGNIVKREATDVRTLSSKTIVNYANNQDNIMDFELFYWTEGRFLYEQAIELTEGGDYSDNGYTLTVDTNGKGKYDLNNTYYYSPFYDFVTNTKLIAFHGFNGTEAVWRYYISNDNQVFLSSNAWHASGNMTSAAISPPRELDSENVVFTNERNVKVRFVLVDESDGVNRLNGGVFKLQRLGTGDDCELTLISDSFRANGESDAKKGRMKSEQARSTDGSLEYDASEAEIVFKRDGKYLLTELDPPPGYKMPDNVNARVIELTVQNGMITASPVYNGIDNKLLICERLREWNNHEVSADNEYAIVVCNEPIETEVIIENVDSTGNTIISATPAKFSFEGATSQTGQRVSRLLTVSSSTGRTEPFNVLYGSYTIEQISLPGDGYKKAENTSVMIMRSASETVLTAVGANVAGVVHSPYHANSIDTDVDRWIIKIRNEVDGYNLTIVKQIIGDNSNTHLNDTFTVDVASTNSSVTSGKRYNVLDLDNPSYLNTILFDSSGKGTLSISPGQRLVIRALNKNSEYIVKESDTGEYRCSITAYYESAPGIDIGTLNA